MFAYIDTSPETKYREWLQERYRDTWRLVIVCFNVEKQTDSTQALVTAMRLIGHEGRYPLDQQPTTENYYFPLNRFRNILIRLLSSERLNTHLMQRFKEYGAYLDVLFYAWKFLPGLTTKGTSSSDIYIQNYLDLIAAIPITTEVQETKQYLCYVPPADGAVLIDSMPQNQSPFSFDYPSVRKYLNKAWQCTIMWEFTDRTHKQMLIVLLEIVMMHLDKPVLLTDFLMDSLDVGE